ncbi:MAG TPA: HAD-IC family P-type ATPase, partial [Bacillota bacterium]|nr:HAD-IC family P-type ATPase [Bacillota bacterium]
MKDYQKTVEQIIQEQSVNIDKGLSKDEVLQRQELYGPNELREKRKTTLFEMFLAQFNDFLVIILLIAAAVSIVLGIIGEEGLVDGIVILAIVILNAVLGVIQEQRANNALAALKKMSSPSAKVIRDGKAMEIPSPQLTIGDIVLLETGDYVAADIRLLDSTNLRSDESALTGESTPVEKDALAELKAETVLAERRNSVYMSTLVTYGKGKGIVTNIGMDTEIGKIATMLDMVQEGKTPLQKTIDQFAKMLGIICIAVSVVVFGLGLLQGQPVFDIFLT